MSEWDGVRERVLALGPKPRASRPWRRRAPRVTPLLADPLTEAEVASTERQFGVALPADCRGFLLEVAAAGLGPGYGIAELACRDGAWTWLEWAAYEPRAGSLLARPFPSDEEKATLAARRGRLQDEAAATGHAAVTAFRAAEDELYPAMTAGAVQLSHEGCGYYTWLVVTGDERGTLWFDPWCSDSPLAPLGDPGHVGFAEWYLAWLDEMATTAR
jgi:hypothetical protein